MWPMGLLFFENYVILYYKNNFTIYLVIISDFDEVKLGKIQQVFVKLLWMFYKNH